MRIRERSEWGARPMRANHGTQKVNEHGTTFVHYSAGQGRSIQNLEEQKATMRALQNFHMDGRGWADIAYNYVIFQPYGRLRRARVFRGRPENVVPAAQENHNSNTIAICVVADGSEPLKAATLKKIAEVAKLNPTSTLGGHYQVTLTDCPGPRIRPHLSEIAKLAGKRRYL